MVTGLLSLRQVIHWSIVNLVRLETRQTAQHMTAPTLSLQDREKHASCSQSFPIEKQQSSHAPGSLTILARQGRGFENETQHQSEWRHILIRKKQKIHELLHMVVLDSVPGKKHTNEQRTFRVSMMENSREDNRRTHMVVSRHFVVCRTESHLNSSG